MALKLSKLPDRTPIRMTIALPPDLASALSDYAKVYHTTYGAEEKPEALVPAILESFLSADTGFKRARKTLHTHTNSGD